MPFSTSKLLQLWFRFLAMLNFSPQIPAESTDLVDSASDGPADDGQVQKCQQLNIIFSL